MYYHYPALYKYLATLLVFFLFMRHYRNINQENYVLLTIVLVSFVFVLDSYFIDNTPNIFTNKPAETNIDNSINKNKINNSLDVDVINLDDI